MKKQQLYIKLPNGRYAKFVEPQMEVDNKLYQKINGIYTPYGMELMQDNLPEGIWVVTREKSCRSYTNAGYLRELFRLDKAADIEEVSLAQLGGLKKLANEVLNNLPKDNRQMTTQELVYWIVGEIYKLNKVTP